MTKRKRPNKARKIDRRQRFQRSDPTPEEIAEACRRIRDVWSDREHIKRAGGHRPEPFRVPYVVYTPHASVESADV